MRRLMCQPGMAAACAVAVVTLADAIRWGLYIVETWPASRILTRYWRGSAEHLGPAVAGVWLALWISGRWRPEPGWIDRFGRLLGGFWVLSLVAFGWRFGRWIDALIYSF
jgi:hypothetical protein